MFCYFNNGFSMLSVDNDYAAQQGEVLFPDYATPEQLTAAFPGYATTILSQTQAAQLSLLNDAAAAAYTAGFQSSASGTPLWYDSDKDTQKDISDLYMDAINGVMATTIYFTGVSAGQVPMRGKPSQSDPDSAKVTNNLTAAQIITLRNDLKTMLTGVKSKLWGKQAAVNAATTIEAVQAITW